MNSMIQVRSSDAKMIDRLVWRLCEDGASGGGLADLVANDVSCHPMVISNNKTELFVVLPVIAGGNVVGERLEERIMDLPSSGLIFLAERGTTEEAHGYLTLTELRLGIHGVIAKVHGRLHETSMPAYLRLFAARMIDCDDIYCTMQLEDVVPDFVSSFFVKENHDV